MQSDATTFSRLTTNWPCPQARTDARSGNCRWSYSWLGQEVVLIGGVVLLLAHVRRDCRNVYFKSSKSEIEERIWDVKVVQESIGSCIYDNILFVMLSLDMTLPAVHLVSAKAFHCRNWQCPVPSETEQASFSAQVQNCTLPLQGKRLCSEAFFFADLSDRNPGFTGEGCCPTEGLQ